MVFHLGRDIEYRGSQYDTNGYSENYRYVEGDPKILLKWATELFAAALLESANATVLAANASEQSKKK